MLDERLLGSTFILSDEKPVGEVMLLGIRYHYHVLGKAAAGERVVVVAVGALGLKVVRQDAQLQY